MCTDTIPVLAYVKIELFFADICYYQRINPKPVSYTHLTLPTN